MPRKLLLTLLLGITAAASSRWEEEGREWWKNVEYLASDNMQGRNVGTPGFDLAASYVAEQFERVGLKAGGNDGYYQKVWFAETSLLSAGLNLKRDGRVFEVPLPNEAHISFSMYSVPFVEAPVVFAGFGLQIPEANYDDLRGLPLKGAIVAYLTGSPDYIAGNLRAHYSSAEERWKAMKAAGAVGMVAIQNPKAMEISWAKQSAAWGLPRMALADTKLNHFSGMLFSASWNPMLADDLLSGAGHSFADILEKAERNRSIPHFATGCKLSLRMASTAHLVKSKNVVAVHPGIDGTLRDEYVIVSAHLDHLGLGKPVHRDAVFNGAMDDASGVSSVIEIAKMLKNVRTKRSILFLALTGEEKGELGSEYFAKYPSVKGQMVADINMDMFLPLFPLKRLEVQGLDESTLGADIKAVAEAAGVTVQADREPEKERFTRSDQYSFVKVGVPALAFKFGYQKGDPEEKILQQWYANRYHAVSDDADQPVDFAAAARFNDLLRSLLLRVADSERTPQWHDDSFFKRFALNPGI